MVRESKVFEKRVFGIRFWLFRSLTISAIDLLEERGETRIRRTGEKCRDAC